MQPAKGMSGKLQLWQLMCTEDGKGRACGKVLLPAAALRSLEGSPAKEEHALCGHRWAVLHAHTLGFASMMAPDYLKSTPPPSFGSP